MFGLSRAEAELNVSVRDPRLAACQQFNNAQPANQVYEQNQKVLNVLYLKQTRCIELNQTDTDALHAIAQQCLQTRVIEQRQILDLPQTLDILVSHLNSGVHILSSSRRDGGLPTSTKFVVIR